MLSLIPSSVSGKTDPVQYTYDSFRFIIEPTEGNISIFSGTSGVTQEDARENARENAKSIPWALQPPDLYGAYRTTVEMPPPPLVRWIEGCWRNIGWIEQQKKVRGPRRQMPDSIPETYRGAGWG